MKKIEKREIVICIVLSVITCGIYGIIWFVNMTNDAAKVSGDENFSGGKAFLFNLITCGIYGIWWAYHMGELIKSTKQSLGMDVEDYPTIYLILMICTYFTGVTGMIMYALAQNELNKIADKVYV